MFDGLDEKEREELTKDFRTLRENHREIIKKKKLNLDDYIEFLKVCWRFSNYPKKPFKKITGADFRFLR